MTNENTAKSAVFDPGRVRATHIGHLSWVGEWFDGVLWRYVKARLLPRANAKYRTKIEALSAATARLPQVKKTRRTAHAGTGMAGKTTKVRTEDPELSDKTLMWISRASYFG